MKKILIKLTLIITFFVLLLSIKVSITKAVESPFTILFEDNFESSNLDKWQIIGGEWTIGEFQGSKWVVANTGNHDYEIQAGDYNWNNYEFSVDVLPRSGVDKNIFFRVNNARSNGYLNKTPVGYGLHLTNTILELQKWTPTNGYLLSTANVSFPYDQISKIRIIVNNENIKIYVGNSPTPSIEYNDLTNPILTGRIALAAIPGASTSEVWYDNISVSTLTPPLPSLIVPDIKQYSQPWNSQIYDSANNWYPSNPTIERWGCALTSAAMVLNYFNHQIDPGVLNTWLKAQPDGYLRNGLLNWLSVSRYTLQHSSSSSPTLEYKRQDSSHLVPELTESRPAILEEPGHFVVAKSQLPTTFGINDPAYSNRPTLESYNNSFLSLGSYIPSHTDLSYIYLLIDPAFKIEVFDPAGNKIEGFSFTSQPITDNFSLQTSGTPLNTFMYPKPEYGEYRLEISGPTGQYQLDSYLYNQNGEVQLSSFKRSISTNEIDTYKITVGETPQISQQSTFESLLEDLANAWNHKKITKEQTYNLLRLEIALAQKLNLKENFQATRSLLTVAKLHLKLFTPSFIDKNLSETIQNEIQSLLDTLIQTS